MPKYEVKEVLASRELVFRGDDGIELDCTVTIGQPFERAEHEWVCPYEISLGNDRKTFGIYGVDSMQAVALALKTLDVEIEIRAREVRMTPTWLGEKFSSVFDPRDVVRM